MNVVGIISEYNPFHSGHAYQIAEAKKRIGADFAVVLMNGDFVQRGEPAIFDKYTRTRQALEGGADMVFEMPVRFGTSSAGDFATGGVLSLAALGFVTHLCFGSECGVTDDLLTVAKQLVQESDDFKCILNEALKEGLSYPAAREKALIQTCHTANSLLSLPNNILGIEYCAAIERKQLPLIPFTIKRNGMDYHAAKDTEKEVHPSATLVRKQIIENKEKHLTLDDFSPVIGYALRKENDLAKYKDISADLADRIKKLLNQYVTASDFATLCQTRTFTLGRIRRSFLQCLLGIENSDMQIPYLRLLGMKKEAGSLLRKPTSCHILSDLPASEKELSTEAKKLLAQDIFASDLYRQTFCQKYACTLPNEYQHSPIVLP